MRVNKVDFKEIVELFVISTIYDLKNEIETPKINIVFKEEAFNLFYEVMNNPHILEDAWSPNIEEKDINLLRKQNDINCPTLYVKDHMIFFKYLTEIINKQVILYDQYNEYSSARALALKLMRRIWLRLGVDDFNNVERFLQKQLEFVQNDIFNDYKDETIIGNFYGCNVTAKSVINYSYDEAPLGMKFKIYDENNQTYHTLPHVFYGIENDTCYIYAVQNERFVEKISKIERLLYKLNKGIENPNIHPSKVYTMILFIKLLRKKGINKIKIPTLQVLSYRYHELLSIKEKNDFSKKWNKQLFEDLKYSSESHQKYKLKEYKRAKIWYEHVVDKEDTISRLKTEELINLMYRVICQDESLTLINDIDISDTLIIKLNNKVKKRSMHEYR